MEIRFRHHRLAWIVAAAALGITACTAGKGEAPEGTTPPEGGTTEPGTEKPGTPGGTTPGGTTVPTTPPNEKPGQRPPRGAAAPGHEVCPPGSPRAPRRTSEMGRPVLVDSVCADIVTTVEEVGSNQPLSDAQIVALLAVMDDNDIAMARIAAQRVRDTRLQGLAQLELASHARAVDAQAKLAQSASPPEDSTLRRQVTDRGTADLAALQRSFGPELNRQYLCRQIANHEHALRILDALAAQVKDPEVHCAVEEERVLDRGHLDFAYWLLTSMVEGRGRGYYEQLGRGQKVKADEAAEDAGEEP
jgi:hypothetical protein